MARSAAYAEALRAVIGTAYEEAAAARAPGAKPMERAALHVVAALIGQALDDGDLPVAAEVVAAEEFARLARVSLETAVAEMVCAADDVLLYAVHDVARRILLDLEAAAALDVRDGLPGAGERATPRAMAVARAGSAVWWGDVAAKEDVAERLRTLAAGLGARARQYEEREREVFRRLRG
jgi:hypothetical protein